MRNDSLIQKVKPLSEILPEEDSASPNKRLIDMFDDEEKGGEDVKPSESVEVFMAPDTRGSELSNLP